MTTASPLVSKGDIESKASETYGSGKVILRVGNGGAGATGLIKRLATDYLSTRDDSVAIEWVCNHSRNTQLALFYGYVDLALTYERDQEALAVSQGWAKSAGCVFHDHFCLAGPVHDPLGLRNCTTLTEAFRVIARGGHPFHTRGDFSATMFKERSIWSSAGFEPWESGSQQWYKTSSLGPADALRQADLEDAYLLIDRSTLLRQTWLGNISKTTVSFEPVSSDDILMNSCYALYSSRTESKIAREVDAFLAYLHSDRGQQVVASFGESDSGLPFFASVREGYAKSSLVGKRPINKTWSYPIEL